MKKLLLNVLVIIQSGMLLTSCKRTEDTTWEVDAWGAVARGTLSLEDLVPDSLLQADADQLWHLHLTKNLTDFDLDTLVAIPDTSFTTRFIVPLSGGPFNIPAGTQIINSNRQNQFGIANAQLTEVRLSAGKLKYTLRSYINGDLQTTLTVPGLSLNGTGTIIEAHTLPGNQELEGEIDLTGYQVDLTGTNGNSYNRLFSNMNVRVSNTAATAAQVFQNDSIVVDLRFEDAIISYARGYFGQHHYDLNQTIAANEDLHLPDGLINLEGMRMNFRIENYVGVDARIHLNNIAGVHTNTASEVALVNGEIYENFNVTRATDNQGVITPYIRSVELNDQNSNLTNFAENLPDQFVVQGIVDINPLGNVNFNNDFIYTNQPLNLLLDIDLPLNIAMSNLILRDTLDWNGFDLEGNASGKLYLQVNNGFPFSANVQVDFTDVNGGNTTTILQNGQVQSGVLSPTSNSCVATYSLIEIPVSAANWSKLKREGKMNVKATFNTSDYPELVGLYQGYKLDFVLSGNANLPINVH
ncbi:MAG: hypothetical protein RLZZ77_2102 [Bacteroidota bacterium]|jgi:hypothetical protein